MTAALNSRDKFYICFYSPFIHFSWTERLDCKWRKNETFKSYWFSWHWLTLILRTFVFLWRLETDVVNQNVIVEIVLVKNYLHGMKCEYITWDVLRIVTNSSLRNDISWCMFLMYPRGRKQQQISKIFQELSLFSTVTAVMWRHYMQWYSSK